MLYTYCRDSDKELGSGWTIERRLVGWDDDMKGSVELYTSEQRGKREIRWSVKGVDIRMVERSMAKLTYRAYSTDVV